MADMRWEFLPSLIAVQIYCYLPLTDRLNAATTCKQWRSHLFHPLLWRCIHFKLWKGVRRQTKFLTRCFGSFVTEAIVEFDPQKERYIREFYNILDKFSRNTNLQKIALVPTSRWLEEWPDPRPAILQNLLLEALSSILQNADRLEHLSLGCIGEFTHHADSLLSIIAKHHKRTIKALHLQSIKDPNHYGLVNLPSHMFFCFSKLEVLGLDYDYLSPNLLESFVSSQREVQLKKLVIHVHGINLRQQKIPNKVWHRLARHNPSLEVTLNLIHSIDGATRILDLLNPAMPLAHLRIFFGGYFNTEAIHFIAQHMNSKFQTVHIVDAMPDPWGPIFYDDGDDDPFVMLARKCQHLKHFTLIGYAIDKVNVVAISRLRGSELQTFQIAESCIFDEIDLETEDGTFTDVGIGVEESVRNEISANLGVQNWIPIPDDQLDPLYFNWDVDSETAYLHTLMKDQAW